MSALQLEAGGTRLPDTYNDWFLERPFVVVPKEWQAIMDHLRSLPVKNKGELPVILVDERAGVSGRSRWADGVRARMITRVNP